MRLWRADGKSTFIRCSYSDHINPKGFIAWAGLEEEEDLASFSVDSNLFGEKYRISEGDIEEILNRF